MNSTGQLYGSFNARYLSYVEVADTFIPNDHYNKLISRNHTLLMGPRGCGKTTLLKMLTMPACQRYDQVNGTFLTKKLPFRSIYIPTDVQWKRQLDILEKKLGNDNVVEMISRCTVLTTVIESLCNSFSEILRFELLESSISDNEIELSKALIDNWGIRKSIVPTLSSIELYFTSLMTELNAQVNKTLLIGGEISFNEFFYNNFFDIVRIGCKTCEQVLKIEKKHWSLCFDELEIAPNWLQSELLDLLRSTKQDFIFKLTTAPIVSLYKKIKDEINLTAATEGNDYDVIRVWTSDQKSLKEWRSFCDKIYESKLKSRIPKTQFKPATFVFGESYLDLSLKEGFSGVELDYVNDDFKEGTASWFAFKALAQKDKSFEIFLRKKGIDPSNPIPVNRGQVDEIFRKVKQLVIYRLHLKRDTDNLRSRKVVPLYFGVQTVYEICDGNPRILIGLINEFLNLALNEDNSLRALSINEQTRILKNISERYLLVLSSHPESTIELNDSLYNIVDLIEKIANYFFKSAVVEHFKMDQQSAFTVDADLPNKLIKLIEFGLHHGAFVYLDSNRSVDQDGVVNKKFRLSYTLAPFFNLIPRNNKDVKLNSIWKSKGVEQPSLFKSL